MELLHRAALESRWLGKVQTQQPRSPKSEGRRSKVERNPHLA